MARLALRCVVLGEAADYALANTYCERQDMGYTVDFIMKETDGGNLLTKKALTYLQDKAEGYLTSHDSWYVSSSSFGAGRVGARGIDIGTDRGGGGASSSAWRGGGTSGRRPRCSPRLALQDGFCVCGA